MSVVLWGQLIMFSPCGDFSHFLSTVCLAPTCRHSHSSIYNLQKTKTWDISGTLKQDFWPLVGEWTNKHLIVCVREVGVYFWTRSFFGWLISRHNTNKRWIRDGFILHSSTVKKFRKDRGFQSDPEQLHRWFEKTPLVSKTLQVLQNYRPNRHHWCHNSLR